MKLFFISLASSCLSLYIVLPSVQSYKMIINFGDSISDTGNYLLTGAFKNPVIGNLPYGMTFFHLPTGRSSDGRVPVDFLTEAFELPFLPPYLTLKKGQDFYHGVNFAVASLDPKYFYQRKIGSTLLTNYSLSTQLGWFKKLKSSLCNNKQECDNYFKKALLLVGEIGGNDYNYPFFAGVTV
ncbi:putative sinapine esterase [Rosa chinensis]|uniref:Putative sinapine esterase n=1 Tax=Rosa chinensis TaxID=74649 RepID=A0A2P6Q4I5_ROSCH|nr:putative sinapine esterase [Rosa chinensis]